MTDSILIITIMTHAQKYQDYRACYGEQKTLYITIKKILLYISHILPLVDYCINVWGHCSNCHLERIYKMQKRVLRIITDDYNSDAQILFNQLKIMTVYERVEFQTAMLVYKCLNETSPGYLQVSLNLVEQIIIII